jgi:TusA-related sulfurtransferase
MAEPQFLDLRGVRCPVPIVRLNTHSKQMASGDSLSFVADDPAFPLDVQAWARRTGYTLSLDPADEAGGFHGSITRP